MLQKLNETEGLKYQLESKLDEVLKEIESAKARKSALEASLREKKCDWEVSSTVIGWGMVGSRWNVRLSGWLCGRVVRVTNASMTKRI